MSGMNMEEHKAAQLPSPHAGSGTGWQPASVPEPEWMLMRSGWELIAHGVIFAGYNHQGGPRGEGKAESVNWGMLMEQHQLGSGTILFRQMLSAESLTSPHPGFLELFQTEPRQSLGRLPLKGPLNLGRTRPTGLAYARERGLLAVATRSGTIHMVEMVPRIRSTGTPTRHVAATQSDLNRR